MTNCEGGERPNREGGLPVGHPPAILRRANGLGIAAPPP